MQSWHVSSNEMLMIDPNWFACGKGWQTIAEREGRVGKWWTLPQGYMYSCCGSWSPIGSLKSISWKLSVCRCWQDPAAWWKTETNAVFHVIWEYNSSSRDTWRYSKQFCTSRYHGQLWWCRASVYHFLRWLDGSSQWLRGDVVQFEEGGGRGWCGQLSFDIESRICSLSRKACWCYDLYYPWYLITSWLGGKGNKWWTAPPPEEEIFI